MGVFDTAQRGGGDGTVSAQDIAIFGFSRRIDVTCAAAMWTALAILPSLHRVELEFCSRGFDDLGLYKDSYEPICKDLSPFLRHLAELTQIRWRLLQNWNSRMEKVVDCLPVI